MKIQLVSIPANSKFIPLALYGIRAELQNQRPGQDSCEILEFQESHSADEIFTEIKNNKPHVRPQWRISVTKKIKETLDSLYDVVTDIQLKPGSSGKS